MCNSLLTISVVVWLGSLSDTVSGHGLMEDPPSRNFLCGVQTKPDHVQSGGGITPECGEAFDFRDGGYQFMSVLTHDAGRVGVSPLPNNVCGFDSETWNGGATPWDAPMDWPTTPMSPGRNEIKWDIQWGSHFTDTEEFRYWITKTDFVFDPTKALTWDDFEAQSFCTQFYSDGSPNANPDVIPLKNTAQFRTFCEVPSRSGHHVIYGEWGRNEWTDERFHGCIDVAMNDSPPDTTGPQASFTRVPTGSTFTGAGSLVLDASGSTGEDLNYDWSVSTQGDASVYSLEGITSQVATLHLAEPFASQTATISLTITNDEGSSTSRFILSHVSSIVGSVWVDLGPVSDGSSVPLDVGTSVSISTVAQDGVEASYPSTPLVVDSSNSGAWNWPVALSQAMPAGSSIAVGVLESDTDNVVPQYSNTANRIYGHAAMSFTLAQVQFHTDDNSSPTQSPVASPPTDSRPTQSPFESPPTSSPPTQSPVDSPPVDVDCSINVRSSNNPWHGGIDIGFDSPTIVLDFSSTGLELSRVNPQSGVFSSMTINGNLMTLTKPNWLSSTSPGYLGIGGNNVAGLATFTAPTCSAL